MKTHLLPHQSCKFFFFLFDNAGPADQKLLRITFAGFSIFFPGERKGYPQEEVKHRPQLQ